MHKFLSETRFNQSIFLIWLLSSLLILAATWGNVASWRLGDADDYLRLSQIRDLLAGQNWWDVTQYRMNVPEGGPMHWSRLVDIFPALCIALLKPILGQSLAEQSTLMIVPFGTYAAFLFLIGHAAKQIFDNKVALLTAAAAFALPPVINQFLPGRIDHHGWQLVAFAACLYALVDPQRRIKGGIIIGAALAAWMEISVEALPYVVIFMGLLCLRWLSERDAKYRWNQFPVAMASLGVTGFALLLVMEGPAFAVNFCDSFSLFHSLAFLAAALPVVLGSFFVHRFTAHAQLIAKLAFCIVAGAGGIAAIVLSAPQCVGDAFGNLDPLVREHWYNSVPEGLPLWQIQPQFVVQPLAGLIVTTLAAIWFLVKSNARSFYERLEIVFAFLGCVIVGLLVVRAGAYFLTIGLILSCALAAKIFVKSEAKSGIATRLSLKFAAVLILIPAAAGLHLYNSYNALFSASKTSQASIQRNAEFSKAAESCHSYETIRLLNKFPASNLMMGVDVSPSILVLTHHNIVATGHHRNQMAMKDVILTFTSPPEKAREIMAARKIDYLLTCPGSFELYRYEQNAPDGLLVQLRAGNVPKWLTAKHSIGPYKIWHFDGGRIDGARDGR